MCVPIGGGDDGTDIPLDIAIDTHAFLRGHDQ